MEMYWYIKKTLATLMTISVANLTFSCSSPTEAITEVSSVSYIDIPLYFQKQIDELSIENPQVLKTVISNSDIETKEVIIKDWTNELSSFLTIDLNKVAFQNHISKDSSNNTVTYSLNEKNIDPIKVIVHYNNSETKSITINRTTENFLYKTTENMFYEAGKSYSIEKTQKVLLLGTNNYKITGRIN